MSHEKGPRPLHSIRYLGDLLGFAPETLRAVACKAESYYRRFPQSRPGSTKVRWIEPATGDLEKIQARIQKRILDRVEFPSYVHGGVRGRSARSNAIPHVGQSEVLKVDIANFFGTTTSKAVARAWKEHFECGNEVTWLLTRLTTLKGHLPQGTHTSPVLANLVVLPAARAIAEAAQQRRLQFTIFVDDMTVSGTDPGQMIDLIAREIGRLGFHLARRKTAIMRKGGRQAVTGITVNRKVSNGGTKLREIRSDVLKTRRGIGAAQMDRLLGKIAHATSVCPSQGRGLRSFLETVRTETTPG